jgi:hypothetical protein
MAEISLAKFEFFFHKVARQAKAFLPATETAQLPG